jgi:hypothetical protein
MDPNVVTNYSQFGNALKVLDVLNVTRIYDDDPGLSNSWVEPVIRYECLIRVILAFGVSITFAMLILIGEELRRVFVRRGNAFVLKWLTW